MGRKRKHSPKHKRETPKKGTPKHKKSSYWTRWTTWLFGALGLIVFLYLISLLFAADNKLSFDFSDSKTAEQWSIQGAGAEFSHSLRGLKINSGEKNGLLVSSRSTSSEEGKRLTSRPWGKTPYVKLFISPEKYDRNVELVWFVWFAKDKEKRVIPFTIPAKASTVIVDSRTWAPWDQILGFFQQAPIRRVGFNFSGRIEINRIEFLSVLGPADLIKTVVRQLTTFHPIIVGSVNYHYPLKVLGNSYPWALGLLVFLMGFVVLLTPNKANMRAAFAVTLACYILFDLTYFHTLWNHAKASYAISSLYDSRYDEFSSRFGEEFAKLDKLLKEHVPEQSKVAFPPSNKMRFLRESNWIWFLYFGEYKNYHHRSINTANVGVADYVFYYYPRHLTHNLGENILRSNDKKKEKTWKTDLVAEVNPNVKLLKIAYD